MLGGDLPFSAKLKSLLAPGSFAGKGLTVIKSLLVSPERSSSFGSSLPPPRRRTKGEQTLGEGVVRPLHPLQMLSIGARPNTETVDLGERLVLF